MAAYVNATPGKLQEPFRAFREIPKAPINVPTDPDTFLDADGASLSEPPGGAISLRVRKVPVDRASNGGPRAGLLGMHTAVHWHLALNEQ
jgi:hypothetical protein